MELLAGQRLTDIIILRQSNKSKLPAEIIW